MGTGWQFCDHHPSHKSFQTNAATFAIFLIIIAKPFRLQHRDFLLRHSHVPMASRGIIITGSSCVVIQNHFTIQEISGFFRQCGESAQEEGKSSLPRSQVEKWIEVDFEAVVAQSKGGYGRSCHRSYSCNRPNPQSSVTWILNTTSPEAVRQRNSKAGQSSAHAACEEQIKQLKEKNEQIMDKFQWLESQFVAFRSVSNLVILICLELKVARFWEALGADFALGPDRSWGDVHLLFFPILQLNHFYLLCVDFKTERLEIIDSFASTEATRLKYGDTPENVISIHSVPTKPKYNNSSHLTIKVEEEGVGKKQKADKTRTELRLEVRNHWINKRLSSSDVNVSSRLLLPKDKIIKYVLPRMDVERSNACQNRDGVRVRIWDLDTRSEHELSLKQWKTGSFMLTSNWKTQFVRRSLHEGDSIWLSWDSQNGRFLFHKFNAQY
nr:putative B3 domain-containing protein At1g78640 [Ipomoea batatas]